MYQKANRAKIYVAGALEMIPMMYRLKLSTFVPNPIDPTAVSTSMIPWIPMKTRIDWADSLEKQVYSEARPTGGLRLLKPESCTVAVNGSEAV